MNPLVLLVLTAIAAVATPVVASADDELTAEACLACHGGEGLENAAGRALTVVHADAYEKAPHGALPCTTCHTDVTAIPHEKTPERVGTAPCAVCHSEQVEAYTRSIHGRTKNGNGGAVATCSDCHGDLHAVVPGSEAESPTHWTHLASTCAQCHAKVNLGPGPIPVVRPFEAYLASVHGRAVKAGRRAAVCSDCHGSHTISRATEPESSIARANVPHTCGTCHTEILAEYSESVHGEALARGVSDVPVCTDCHGEHRILGPSMPASPVFATNVPLQTCGRCHANAQLSEKYDLPNAQVAAFQDSYHGLALRAGRPIVANCSSCHGVHDIRASSDPRSHVNPANLRETCGKCHPGAGASFALGPVHGGTESPGARAAGWIRFAYLWLIALTIGAMFVHNSLDLTRKGRTPLAWLPAPPASAAPPPVRMTRALRWQHGLVMATFPVLVYTGFALKYPESWWAAPFLQFEGRWALRGSLHRVAAVLMLVGVGWHLVQIAVDRRLRTGMRHIVPAWRDLRELREMLAYYFGRRPMPPHSGTFNYAEKAEYWAFMWGSTLMAATGFALWFENLTLRWLPGWVPEVATALHFWEAVLATLAIVVWHLYWAIFDPAVYPMDWTWWTGRMPPSRAAEHAGDDDAHADE